MKKMKKRIVMVWSILLIAVCFFSSTVSEVKAKEYGNREIKSVVAFEAVGDIPAEITQPIEKGKKLLAYLVMSLGAVAALIGAVFLGIAFLGHQPDMRINGFIFLGVGLLMFFAPIIINWLLGQTLF